MTDEIRALRRIGSRGRDAQAVSDMLSARQEPGGLGPMPEPRLCGCLLAEGDTMAAYYTRPSTTARYFGLRVVCRECWDRIASFVDYVVGIVPSGLSCGDWVSYLAPPMNEWPVFVPADAPPE